MSCPRLKKGKCKVNRKVCNKTYDIKMQKFKTCSIFKKAKKKSAIAVAKRKKTMKQKK